MRANANLLGMPVLVAGLCALPAGSAAVRSSPNPHLRDTHSAYLQRASRQPVECIRGARRPGVEREKRTARFSWIWERFGARFVSKWDRESYSQPDTADFINRHFVAEKVDYDAQPELAATLERAQAVMNLPAGLPLTAFLSPSGKLYFGGGYFPARPSRGKPALRQVLERALRIYRERRTQIERDGFDVIEGE